MKVQQLIQQLSAFPPDAEIVLDTKELGVSDINKIQLDDLTDAVVISTSEDFSTSDPFDEDD